MQSYDGYSSFQQIIRCSLEVYTTTVAFLRHRFFYPSKSVVLKVKQGQKTFLGHLIRLSITS